MNYPAMTDGELSEQWDWQRKIIETPWSVTRKSLAERRLKLIEAELERRKINEKAVANHEPSIRTDTAGRDVTNLPGLWSEDDTIHVPPVGQTLKCNQCKKGGDE